MVITEREEGKEGRRVGEKEEGREGKKKVEREGEQGEGGK